MNVGQIIGNVAAVLLYIGGPVLPLLLLAVKIGRWHNTHPESDE
jgi:hypothetical protein